jgi:hypothetical protein
MIWGKFHTYALRHKGVLGSWCTAPCISNLGTRNFVIWLGILYQDRGGKQETDNTSSCGGRTWLWKLNTNVKQSCFLKKFCVCFLWTRNWILGRQLVLPRNYVDRCQRVQFALTLKCMWWHLNRNIVRRNISRLVFWLKQVQKSDRCLRHLSANPGTQIASVQWTQLSRFHGRTVAQAVSRWLPTAAAQVHVRSACGVCDG